MTELGGSQINSGPRLEDLVPGIDVGGLVGATPVTVVQVQWHGVNFITLKKRCLKLQKSVGIPQDWRYK